VGLLGALTALIGLIDVPDQLNRWASFWQQAQLDQQTIRTVMVAVGLVLMAAALFGERLGIGRANRDEKKLSEVTRLTFQHQTVILDGRRFVDCRFVGCTFRWNGGPFQIDRGTIQGVRFETQHQTVLETVELLRAFGLLEGTFAQDWKRLTPAHFGVTAQVDQSAPTKQKMPTTNALPGPPSAQVGAGLTRFTGRATDALTSEPIAGVRVSATSDAARSTVSDGWGTWSLDLPSGRTWPFRFRREGYDPEERTGTDSVSTLDVQFRRTKEHG
jgi:hypothetical protein